ncbi:2'-5' RNA ligase family protein [Alterisphingorhabdus coralli]|uniref:2'-5' RNA ligase family protein n=1 Tax=Alterisphingorhabdus coralli TaxID=3071408 RepID=A0AA97I2M8_9SPHN|nr:2'-5' RNA ligase family protein [Parasphingorhabdus sp. SCSIO 66989]WOE76575.1 2'-5' RNA ligase family protein [Parasphingorhabdus sp. SCSIO 66989]
MIDRRPIIMTARMGLDDFAWANGLRRRYFPPERNHIAAHITLFHHLPGHYADQVVQCAKAMAGQYAAPSAILSDLMKLGGGVAYRIESPALQTMRAEIAEQFHGLLTAQDQGRPRLHITVQNKVAAAIAKETYAELATHFMPRPLSITGLALHRYDGGPWEDMGEYGFRGKTVAAG